MLSLLNLGVSDPLTFGMAHPLTDRLERLTCVKVSKTKSRVATGLLLLSAVSISAPFTIATEKADPSGSVSVDLKYPSAMLDVGIESFPKTETSFSQNIIDTTSHTDDLKNHTVKIKRALKNTTIRRDGTLIAEAPKPPIPPAPPSIHSAAPTVPSPPSEPAYIGKGMQFSNGRLVSSDGPYTVIRDGDAKTMFEGRELTDTRSRILAAEAVLDSIDSLLDDVEDMKADRRDAYEDMMEARSEALEAKLEAESEAREEAMEAKEEAKAEVRQAHEEVRQEIQERVRDKIERAKERVRAKAREKRVRGDGK